MRERGGIRALLASMRERHYAYAAMHTAAARSAARYHRNFTVAILTITLVTTLVTSMIQEVAPPIWIGLTGNAALALIAGLTAINNFLGYQKREEQHRASKESHLRVVGLIDVAVACDDEARAGRGSRYDFSGVLKEIQEIHDGLKKSAVGIPEWVAKKYPEYEAPWLLRGT